MNEKLDQSERRLCALQRGKSVAELKADLLADLQERYRELKVAGKDDETAFQMTIDSIGDIEQTVQEVANLTRSLERQLLTNFSGNNLPGTDFAGVTARNGKFEGSALRGSDFSGADLTGSSFKGSDAREANFDRANLTDCNFSALDLTNASFRQSILPVEKVDRGKISIYRKKRNLQSLLCPTCVEWGNDIYVRVLPVNQAISQRTGSHNVDNQLPMSAQSLVKRFQMLHRGDCYLE